MVLADDNFATIVSAVEEGRRIYANIRKAIQFLLASNLAEVLAIFFSTMIGFTILKPVHLLWINLITDCFPALALGLEKSEADIMKKKPRDPKEGIFAGGMGFDVFFQGCRCNCSCYDLLSGRSQNRIRRMGICKQCRRNNHGIPYPFYGGNFPFP